MSGRAREFRKYEGLGNDFIVVDAETEEDVAPDRARELCDRRFGVGADGVLLVLPTRVPGCDARMRVINADGSIPEMCGNGVRCVALHVASARGLHSGPVRIETDAGVRACTLAPGATAVQAMVAVDMGPVRVVGDTTIVVDGQAVTVTVADAGNPHAVLFGQYSQHDVEHLGSRIAVHSAFPQGTNVEFARAGREGIDLVVWERGVGVTLACGTGACATVAVACSRGLAAAGIPVAVLVPGGRLHVTMARGHAEMEGPARHVFSGTLAGGGG
jgi:diaminopimelate epimerase